MYRDEVLEAFKLAVDLPKETKVAMTPGLCAQLRFWLVMVYLSQFGFPLDHKSIHAPANALHVFTDAAGGEVKSENGLGGVRVGSRHGPPIVVAMKWPISVQAGSIPSTCALELLAVLATLVADLDTLHGHPVVFHVDNIASVRAIQRGYSKRDVWSTSIVMAIATIAIGQHPKFGDEQKFYM